MKTVFPNYYPDFQCITGACRHSCCIGWEIDIDEETCQCYQNIPGGFGDRLRENISGETIPHFILGEGERCPFLNRDNLCDIILELGENALCQICTDHPRFRNFYTDFTEVGLGLCCEAAAEIILKQTEPFSLIGMENFNLPEEEAMLFSLREHLFELVQNRTLPLLERIQNIQSQYRIAFPKKTNREWAELFLSLDRLEEKWGELLVGLSRKDTLPPMPKEGDIPMEQLLCYFLYRHLPGGLDDGKYRERILFSLLGVFMIAAICRLTCADGFTMENLVEIARMYSSEIEYSEENTAALLEWLKQ